VDTSVFQRPATCAPPSTTSAGPPWPRCCSSTLWLGFAWRSWRVGVIALVAVVLSYIARRCWCLQARGTTFNALVLTGLAVAIGVIVDDIAHHVDAVGAGWSPTATTGRPRRRSSPTPSPAARRPPRYAIAVVAVTLLPIWLLTGFSGAFARPLVAGYALAFLRPPSSRWSVHPVPLLRAAADDRARAPGQPAGHRGQRPGRPDHRSDGPGPPGAGSTGRSPPSPRSGWPPWPSCRRSGGAPPCHPGRPRPGRRVERAAGHLAAGDAPAGHLGRRPAAGRARRRRRVDQRRAGAVRRSDRRCELGRHLDHHPGRRDYAKTATRSAGWSTATPAIAHTLTSYPALAVAEAGAQTAAAPLTVRLYGNRPGQDAGRGRTRSG